MAMGPARFERQFLYKPDIFAVYFQNNMTILPENWIKSERNGVGTAIVVCMHNK